LHFCNNKRHRGFAKAALGSLFHSRDVGVGVGRVLVSSSAIDVHPHVGGQAVDRGAPQSAAAIFRRLPETRLGLTVGKKAYAGQ
jgi:hypothetical protein